MFYSAYLPVVPDPRLPALTTPPPLLREHRLYQADWLLRYYDFSAAELLSDEQPNFDPYLDPKCNWALRHPEFFPVEVNAAPLAALLRVPGSAPKARGASWPPAAASGWAWRNSSASALCSNARSISSPVAAAPRRCAHRGRRSPPPLVDPRAFGVGVQQLSLDDFPCRAGCRTPPRSSSAWRPPGWTRARPPARPDRRRSNVLPGACEHNVSYCYDGSFRGFLCCIYESYARRELPAAVQPPEEGQVSLFGCREIPTSADRARRVAAGLRRLGGGVQGCLTSGFLADEPGKDLTLLRFARVCFENGPATVQMLGRAEVAEALALARRVDNESSKYHRVPAL